jgi:hypothetical protein
MEAIGTFLLILAGLALLALALFVVVWVFCGAVHLFGLAAEQGFIGIAAYIAVWVFMAPIMLVACIIVGILVSVFAKQIDESLLVEPQRERQMSEDN